MCPYLTWDNKCSVHPSRPMICRLYGLVKDELQCRHGCVPERWISPADGKRLLTQALELGKEG